MNRIKPILLLLTISIYAQYEGGFTTPIWDTSVQWEVTRNGGCAEMKLFLEGEAKDAGANAFGFSYTEAGTAGHGYLSAEGGRSFIGWFDVESQRLHRVAGEGYGHMDGPFSRARFGAWYYTWHPGSAFSQDGKFMFMTDKSGSRHTLRKLDFEQQMVSTLLPNLSTDYRGLATGADGRVYIISTKCMLMVLTPSGQIEKTVQLDTATDGGIRGFTPHALPIAIDDVNNRLYCNQSTKSWYTFYWDLSDLSFHGVVPVDAVRRGRDTPGSFEGTDWYFEGSHISFGPDDPNKRFLYMARNDCDQFFRLDLERRWVAAILIESGVAKFVDNPPSSRYANVYASFRWIGNGNLLVGPTTSYLYKRIR
jgi:hypothetical protein